MGKSLPGDMLKEEIVIHIKAFLSEKTEELRRSGEYENTILRDDVLTLLEKQSTVVYFPIENEDNFGFHVVRCLDGQEREFIYLNTARPIVEQIFAAGHELGHSWKLKEYIESKGIQLNLDLEERVMNRFSAELLAPEDSFMRTSRLLIHEIGTERVLGEKVSYEVSESDLVRVMILLMSKYMLPYKAIVCRFWELGNISEEIAERLLGEAQDIFFDEVIQEESLQKLVEPTGRKGIKNFPELLKEAEEKQTLPQKTIDAVREAFEYPRPSEKYDAIQQITMNQKGE